jgi:type II secretory pathway component GspD/PulD (secretin)
MNKFTHKLLVLGLLLAWQTAFAQTDSFEVVVPEGQTTTTVINNPAPNEGPDAGNSEQAEVEGGNANPIEAEEGGFLIKDANINDIFQLLAKRADKQYFHNNKLNTVDYQVTGHLSGDVDSLQQMEELAFQYGLRMYVKGNTVYAMMSDQLNNLPAKEWTYSLQYLRPTDIEQIKALIQPMLSVGRGIVNYEPKTNTIIVIDTMRNIEMVEKLLRKIDKPKGQIVVEVKILRVNNSEGSQTGVDWSSSLGDAGVDLGVARNLNSVFGIDDLAITADDAIDFSASNIVLSPIQVNGVLRALKDNNLVTQKSNPVVITEDNEKASISLIDRVPIITQTVSDTTAGQNTAEEVRYTIDTSDSTDPETTREIGVTISVTPSLLPDGTIRMQMRPRNAQITENVETASGNAYPRVSEATIQSIARIPDGHSLVIGGFYGEVDSKGDNKIPILGDIPLINFFFKSKKTQKEKSSLVFIVTPTSYNPSCINSHKKTSDRLNFTHSLSQ